MVLKGCCPLQTANAESVKTELPLEQASNPESVHILPRSCTGGKGVNFYAGPSTGRELEEERLFRQVRVPMLKG